MSILFLIHDIDIAKKIILSRELFLGEILIGLEVDTCDYSMGDCLKINLKYKNCCKNIFFTTSYQKFLYIGVIYYSQ